MTLEDLIEARHGHRCDGDTDLGTFLTNSTGVHAVAAAKSPNARRIPPSSARRPTPGLAPEREPLASLAIAWNELTTTGDATRLKRCAEHTCAWAFWDVSKNRSRRWCSMRVCGNRNKSRTYASRKRQTA